MNDNKISKETHVTLHARRSLKISGITDVISFCEENILLESDQGNILIEGKELHINQMSVDKGEIEAEGYFSAISYGEIPKKAKNGEKSAISKLFK